MNYMQPVCSFGSQLSSCLELVLRGIKKTQRQNTPLVHLPITIQLMCKLKEVLAINHHDYDNIMMWVACYYSVANSLLQINRTMTHTPTYLICMYVYHSLTGK